MKDQKKTNTDQKPVTTTTEVKQERKPWTRHVKTYYIFDPAKGFLLKDKTFGITGEHYTFDNVVKAKMIQEFFEGTVILTTI